MGRLAKAESAKRVRAALAYAGFENLDEASRETGIAKGTLRNYTSKARPTTAPKEKRELIAAKCGVPESFMEDGFDAVTGRDVELAREVREHRLRIARLELQLGQMQRRAGEAEGGTGQAQAP